VVSKINVDELEINCQIPLGSLFMDLKPANGVAVDFNACFRKLLEKKQHQAHGAIFAKSKDGRAVDPVEMTLKSDESDSVLDGIRERISKAAKTQLDKSTPGFISCFLEGINDLSELATGSGLQIMTSLLFPKDELSHIAAVGYCSESIVERTANTETFFNQGLIFRNPNCKFEKAKDFQFLSEVTKNFECRLS
jgi:hypothetical protein